MPRRNEAVKSKHPELLAKIGAVDLHFHGAFGIDLMVAREPDLEKLGQMLFKRGVAAFCPTTLSSSAPDLAQTVSRLGAYIKKVRTQAGTRAAQAPWKAASRLGTALPLGIHLEGPFINDHASGAHPKGVLRKASLSELEALWEKSFHTIKLITLAPEIHLPEELKGIAAWARKRKIRLSLGHSCATTLEARAALRTGFTHVTHAWNAMPFHQRQPGILGAALGNKNISIELIIDQVHVSPEVMRWTQTVHPSKCLCFVSDAAPSACLSNPKQGASFGGLEVFCRDGASRIETGALAGGGSLLSEMFLKWCEAEAKRNGRTLKAEMACQIVHVRTAPLKALI